MSTDRHLARLAVYILFRQDGKILLLRRHNTGYRDGQYTLPAGHVDPDESFIHTCIREGAEETGLTIDPAALTLAHVMQRHEPGTNYDDYVDYYFVCDKWMGVAALNEPDKADDLQWVTLDEAKELAVIDYVVDAIEYIDAGVMYSHRGFAQ